jgi:hypothetical protein
VVVSIAAAGGGFRRRCRRRHCTVLLAICIVVEVVSALFKAELVVVGIQLAMIVPDDSAVVNHVNGFRLIFLVLFLV